MLAKVPKYYFSKNICVIAGGPHMDLVGAKIIAQMKTVDPDTKFFGIGGQQMKTAGLDKTYADVSKFLNKPLYPYKNFKHFHIERPYHPVYGFYHAANRKVRDQVDKSDLFKDILETKPDAFLCLQNDFFMNRFYNFLNELYDKNNLVKPPVFHYDRTHINQRQEFTDWLDHQFSVNPLKPLNFANYTFPSTVVGHEGVGRAWQYLYRTNEKYASLTNDNHIYLSPEHNQQIIEKLIAEERVKFRAANGISEGQQVIFLAPGNESKDLNWTAKVIKAGIVDYLKRPENLNIDKSHFVLMVCVPEGSFAANIESAIKGLNLPLSVKFSNQKYASMAGSDFGLAYNGEIVSECAAMQLPVTVIENMNYPQAHLMQLYNHFNNELNIATKGETQQELICTTATPYRISEELSNMSDPKHKYYIADKFKDILYQMVPRSSDVKGTEVAVDNQTFVKHGFSYDVLANKVISAANTYSASEKSLPHYKINDYRLDLLQKAL